MTTATAPTTTRTTTIKCGRCGGSGIYAGYGTCYGCGGHGTRTVSTAWLARKAAADKRTAAKFDAIAAADDAATIGWTAADYIRRNDAMIADGKASRGDADDIRRWADDRVARRIARIGA